ncbi:hypothetical protein PRIPAC_82415 [Pristionchus pacificus]|nr:hypothetical protein PRIPAC_82415 [Pristionchus pacificus]
MEERICLVCSVPITNTHLGVEVCRACASFFKRTTLAGRSYTCRQSEGKCTFRKHEEFMCQSCRHDRCIELGMVYIEPPKRRPRRKKIVIDEDRLPSLSPPRTNLIIGSIIDRVDDAYKSARARRLVRERHYVENNDLELLDHPSKELYIMHFTDFREILGITVSESRKIVEEAFDEYGNLSPADQAIVFKNFFGNFRFLEIFYLSSQVFGDGPNYMSSLITCIDANKIDEWVTVKDDVESKDELQTSLQGFLEEYLILIAPMLRIDKLTEREFHALLVLAFCDNVIDLPLSAEIFKMFEKMRLKVIEEMQDYYKNDMRLNDFSERLGNLLIVSHGAGEAGIIFYKELRIYNTIFNFYFDDLLIRETFLN